MTLNVRRACRRLGFTLIEMLVVITILVVLGGLTVVVVTAVYKGQAGVATDATIHKTLSELDRQWKAAIDNAKDEFRANRAPAALSSNYGTDPDLARRIYIRLRLEQEFPQSIAEATTGPQYPPLPAAALVTLGPKKSYTNQLAGQNPGSPQAESSACLIVALGEGRRGTLTNLEEALGPSVFKFLPNVGAGKDSKVLMDTWGKAIAFRRIPTGKNNVDWLPEIYSAGMDKQYGTGDDVTSQSLRQQGARGDQ